MRSLYTLLATLSHGCVKQRQIYYLLASTNMWLLFGQIRTSSTTPNEMRNRFLHEFLKRVFSPVHVRIRGGPLMDAKWILSTGAHFIAGTYEPEKTRCITETTKAGMTVLDIGAHVGYFSLIMSQMVGSSGEIHAFEPRDLNRDFLKTHIRLNKIRNVRVHPECVGDQIGQVRFETRTGSGTGHVSGSGNITVLMTTIDALVKGSVIPLPDLIKIDVEGTELPVLKGGYETIRKRRPTMILAVHSEPLELECRTLLEPMGYVFKDLGQSKGDREFLVTT